MRPFRVFLPLKLFCFFILYTLSVCFAATTPIGYVYDSLGRLKAVIDPAADTAVYNYDAVGNVLSIERRSSSIPSIIEFTPKSGPVGTSVTIYGTTFSDVPAQNTVTFNGVSATVLSSSSTQIVATVPAGASTGPIGVTSPAGSVTSSDVFAVTTTQGGAPTITGFSPSIGTAGTPVTITGTNFETTPVDNTVRFNLGLAPVSGSTATSIATSVPTLAGSGRIYVATPAGIATSANDFFIAPSPYTAADVVHTGRMAVDGASYTATINTAGKIALVVFDGTGGQTVGLGFNSHTLPTWSTVVIRKPDGSILMSSGPLGTEINYHVALPVTGTYTIMIAAPAGSTGNVTMTLSSEVNAGTIVLDGAAKSMTLSRVGQRGWMDFTGTPGQKVSVGLVSSTISTLSELRIFSPSGIMLGGTSTLNPNGPNNNFYNFHMTLPETGTYKIRIDPYATSTGSVTLTLVSEVNAGSIALDGASLGATTTKIGQRARMTFTGTAQQWVSLGINSTSFNADLKVYDPNGGFLESSSFLSQSTNLHMKLPSSGTYTIYIDPYTTSTGTVVMTLSTEVNGGVLQINGPSLPIATSRVGQRGRFSFQGTAGQQVTVRTSNNTTWGTLVILTRTNGNQLLLQYANPPASNLSPVTLPATETYYVLIDPDGTLNSNLSVAVTNP